MVIHHRPADVALDNVTRLLKLLILGKLPKSYSPEAGTYLEYLYQLSAFLHSKTASKEKVDIEETKTFVRSAIEQLGHHGVKLGGIGNLNEDTLCFCEAYRQAYQEKYPQANPKPTGT